MPRKTEEDYHELAAECGYEWTGPFPLNTRTKTKWKCSEGHVWNVSYNSIHQGHRCRHCAGQTLKIARDYYELAQKRDFEWIGDFPPTTDDKTLWGCPRGHEWTTSYGKIKQGRGCPYCSNRVSKTNDDYYELAEERGFKWLGPRPPIVIALTGWGCPSGHLWQASYNNVSRGTGCPECAIKDRADRHRTGLDEYLVLAQKKGFKWIDTKVPNSILTKTLWECSEKHRWEACFNNIRNGCGCPLCIDMVNGARVSQIQRKLCEMLNGELNYPCGSYNIDVALPDEGIAIEYDSWYWHGDKIEDGSRDEYLLSEGWKVLHIKSNGLLPTKSQISRAVRALDSTRMTEITLEDWGHGPVFTGY